jgi:prepilin-type N-terminal cleavage/methylation domain-containing protein
MDHHATAPCAQGRQGFSLLEVIIVMGITGMMMAALIQAMMGVRQYASTAEVQDDLNVEAQRIIAIIREDLGASGWYLPVGAPDAVSDRGNLYFPYVQSQQAGKLGKMFPHHDRLAYTTKDWVTVTHYPGLPGSEADWDAATLAPLAYRSSFYARSQEIIFLKVMKGSFNPDGLEPLIEPVDFQERSGVTYAMPGRHETLGIRRMNQWDRGTDWDPDPTKRRWYITSGGMKVYDPYVPGIWLRPASASAGMGMPLRWETMTRYPNQTTSGMNPPIINLREIREYSYAVVPNPNAGNRGQLVRAFKKPATDIKDSAGNITSGAAATDWIIGRGDYQPDAATLAMPSVMVVDRVISDKVDRITFDTFRTDAIVDPNNPLQTISGLEINQVRMRIFLSKKSTVDIGAAQKLVVEATVSMRSTSDTNAINDLMGQLGDGGTVILH